MLTFTCPVCGLQLQADNLADMRKHVHVCGRKPSKRTFDVDPTPLVLPVELRFSRRVASQNKTTFAHWSVHHKDKADWREMFPATHTLYGRKLAKSSWELEDLRAGRAKQYDFANLVGGAKPLIDLLIEFGIIIDDRPACFECNYNSSKAEQSGTILRLVHAQ